VLLYIGPIAVRCTSVIALSTDPKLFGDRIHRCDKATNVVASFVLNELPGSRLDIDLNI